MKKLLAKGLLSAYLLATPALALAVTTAPDCPEGYTAVSVKVSGSRCVKGIYAYLNQIVTVMEGLIGVGVVIAIVVAGVQYITSAGNPDAVKTAKSRLGNAIIGLVVYLMLFSLVEWLGITDVIS